MAGLLNSFLSPQRGASTLPFGPLKAVGALWGSLFESDNEAQFIN
jgi:hypothetical protein